MALNILGSLQGLKFTFLGSLFSLKECHYFQHINVIWNLTAMKLLWDKLEINSEATGSGFLYDLWNIGWRLQYIVKVLS